MMKKIPYCIYRGKRIYEGDGLYTQVSKRFLRGGAERNIKGIKSELS